MSNILDTIELSVTFNSDELIQKLFIENLKLRAEVNALSGMVASLISSFNGLSDDQSAKIVVDRMKDSLYEVFVNHPLLSEGWRDRLKKEFNNPGFSFE